MRILPSFHRWAPPISQQEEEDMRDFLAEHERMMREPLEREIDAIMRGERR